MIDKLDKDLKAAMLGGQSGQVTILRGLKSSLKNEQIKLRRDLTDDEAIAVLRREAKQRDESAAVYTSGGAGDKAEQELAEKAIIEAYLPAMMPTEDIDGLVDQAIDKLGADSQNIGIIIGQVMSEAKGLADGRQVAEAVKRKLSR